MLKRILGKTLLAAVMVSLLAAPVLANAEDKPSRPASS